MNEMREQGTTLLFVSHSIEAVREVCDKVLWINKGEKVMEGLAQDVCEAYMKSLG